MVLNKHHLDEVEECISCGAWADKSELDHGYCIDCIEERDESDADIQGDFDE